MFGGGNRDFMNEVIGVELPLSVGLLFQNEKLDIVSLLCITSCFLKNRKGISLEEISFYYAIITSDAEISINGESWDLNNEKAKIEVDANLILIRDKIKKFIIVLINIGLVDYEFIDKQFYIKINKSGLNKVNTLINEYFTNIIHKTNVVKEHIKFNKTNEKRIVMGAATL